MPKAPRKPKGCLRQKPFAVLKGRLPHGLESSSSEGCHLPTRLARSRRPKSVHAVDGGEAQPFEPRKEVPVSSRRFVRREQMKLTLLRVRLLKKLMARLRIAEIEAARLEALALIADTAPF